MNVTAASADEPPELAKRISRVPYPRNATWTPPKERKKNRKKVKEEEYKQALQCTELKSNRPTSDMDTNLHTEDNKTETDGDGLLTKMMLKPNGHWLASLLHGRDPCGRCAHSR